jgi:pimeloyl-ACP methyl ester carboxylesterase
VPSVQANGLTFEYESIGNPSDPAIVLIMGLGVQMILWPDEFYAMLAARGFRAVRFDNRDAGLSTQLDHLGSPNVMLQYAKYLLHLPLKSPYLIDDMARDTVGILDALGIARPHLVGASMGGMIAQNVAANFPDRVASLTSIMSKTGSRKLPPPEKRAIRALLQKPAKKGDVPAAAARLKRLLRAIGSDTYPTDEAELTAFCERHSSRAHNPPGQMRQLLAISASGDRTPVVRRIKAPTLVIHGTEDPLLLPECGRATAQAIAAGGGNAKLVEVEGMGHDLPRPLWPKLVDLIVEHCQAADRA